MQNQDSGKKSSDNSEIWGKDETAQRFERLMKAYKTGGEQAFDRAFKDIIRSHQNPDEAPEPRSKKD